MVLQQPFSFPSDPDSPPNSSPDPYSSSSSAIDVDITELPSPIIFPFSLTSKSKHMYRIKSRLESRAAQMHRPLTPDETAATAYYMAQFSQTLSYTECAGMFSGMIRAFNTRKIYRFPFAGALKNENGWFDGERVRIMGREIVRGEIARILVNSARTSAYISVGALFASWLGTFWAGTGLVVHEMNDPRLQAFTKDERDQYDQRMEKRRESMTRKGPANPAWKLQKDRGAIEGDAEANRDDKNPTGREGEVEFTRTDSTSEMRDGESFRNESPIGSRGNYPSPEPSRPWPSTPSAPKRKSPPPPRPTEPLSSNADTNADTTTGSAWERIRREASSTAPTPHEPRRATDTRAPDPDGPTTPYSSSSSEEAGPAPPKGDDFSFPGSELERGYAREEAQRDFDARVERERRGGDFNERGW